MALTFSRWLLLVVLLCAIVAVGLLPPPPGAEMRNRFSPTAATRLQRLTGQLERARVKLRVTQLSDSITDRIRRHPLSPGGVPSVMDLGAATEEERAAYSEILARWWPTGDSSDSVAVGIVLGGDSSEMVWQSQHLLPASTGGRACITLVPTHTWRAANRLGENVMQRRFAAELGPCLFFGMYGRPGSHIERWIGGRGIDFATYFSPSGRLLPDDDSEGIVPAGPFMFEMEWRLYGTMPLGMSCLGGQVEQCASAVYGADSAADPMHPGFRTPSAPWRAPFGALSGSYLADLHRALGPVAFAKFWRSTAPFDQALKEATGMELGEWTHHWVIGRRGAFRPGPLPERRSVARVAGLTVLLLGIALVYGRLRTVES